MASGCALIILRVTRFTINDSEIKLFETRNHGLLVLQSEAEALFFDSHRANKNHGRWRENAVPVYQYFKIMWPNVPLPPEIPGTKSSAYQSQQSSTELIAPSQSTLGFDYLASMSVQRLMKTELHDYQRHKAARAFHALITLMCKSRPVVNLQRLGDNATVILQLGDSGHISQHCLWTDRVFEIVVAEIYSKLQRDYHDEENDNDWFPDLRSASSLPIATYLLICLNSAAPELLQTYGLKTLAGLWDHAKNPDELPKWTTGQIANTINRKTQPDQFTLLPFIYRIQSLCRGWVEGVVYISLLLH
jgi:hypothetical protein